MNIELILGIVLLIMAAIIIVRPKSLDSMSRFYANTTCYLLVMYTLHLIGTLKAELNWGYALWCVGLSIAWFILNIAAVKFIRKRALTT